MHTKISTRHGHLSTESQEKIIAKLEKLNRFHDRIASIEATLDLEHESSPGVEIRVAVNHAPMFLARTQGPSLMGAIDGAIHKLEQQLRRHKEKLIHSHRSSVKRSFAGSAVAEAPEELPSDAEEREIPELNLHVAPNKGKGIKMKFADFVCRDAISASLEADDKESVIGELVDSLVAAGEIAPGDRDAIVAAVMKREELGSTGIGRGIAVPHTKHPNVRKLVGTVGLSEEGIDFDSLDGEKVQLFFLLISPPDRPGDHLRALENISRQLREDTFCRFLKQAKTPADVIQLLEEADNNHFVS